LRLLNTENWRPARQEPRPPEVGRLASGWLCTRCLSWSECCFTPRTSFCV